jgi:acetolactate synthase-1/2/3 large subunit
VADLQRRRQAWRAEVAASAKGPAITPQLLVERVRAALPPAGILVAGAGNPGVWSHLMDVYEPRTYLKPVGFGNMGFALPAAIAAKLARPDRPVLALIGDGALGMCVSELETAVRERTPLAVVVMNNRAYGQIKQEHDFKYGPRYIGVDLGEVRFDLVAQGFGAQGERVDRPDRLDAALQRAVAGDRATVLDVLMEDRDNVWKEPF